jgi:hypothetical protein
VRITAVNPIGCTEMSESLLVAPITFTITVIEEEQGSKPMSEQAIKDYLWAVIESKGTLAVLNIVRDY